jgi:hypothetical protein
MDKNTLKKKGVDLFSVFMKEKKISKVFFFFPSLGKPWAPQVRPG